MKMLSLALISLWTACASAQTEHELIRRISVFPIKVAQPELAKFAEEAWWELREALTRDKRFLVASKNFLQQKDVYQARSILSPADAIILGKLLDANALVTTYVDDRVLYMKVYEGEYGRPLWEQQLVLQPSLPIAQQLQPGVIKLVQDFIASIPYHGFVVLDPLKGRPVYQEGRRLLVKAEVGGLAEVDVGDSAQLIRVYSDHLKPLFTHGASIEVFAEGRVVEHNRESIVIELDRLNRATAVQEGTLVRLPRELKRLEELYSIQDSLKSKIDPEFFSPGMTAAKQKESETKPLIASLAFIANLAAFLLLAF
ncbi:MAG: hypothetical protein KF799_16105 [Bdellovibrionales bacterium]|nr:hypothetical protein [Bdellovibrionales bacterium]